MVMMFHVIRDNDVSASIRQLTVIGQTGVDLFFVLSGFLITRILIASKNSPNYFSTFYARRSLRIFPLYYAFLVIYFFALPLIYSYPIPDISKQAWAWLYLENIPDTFRSLMTSGPPHFWSLSVEEHFYLFWPLLVWATSRRQLTAAAIAILLTAPMLRLAFVANGISVFYFTLTRMDALAFGALLAVIVLMRPEAQRAYRTAFRVLLIGLLVVLLPAFMRLSGTHAGWVQVAKFSLIPALYFSLIGLILVDPIASLPNKILASSVLRWLGSISYGLYILHPACFDLIQRFAGAPNLAVRVSESFVLTIALATISYYFFESPIRRLNARFEYGPTRDGKRFPLLESSEPRGQSESEATSAPT